MPSMLRTASVHGCAHRHACSSYTCGAFQGDSVNKVTSIALRVLGLVAGCTAFVMLAGGSVGLAQQAPGAAAGAPPAGQRGGAPGAPGQGGGRGPVVDTLGAGPWDFGGGAA